MTTQVALRKTSLVDYPGRISAVIFFRGCNLRCPWCHNPELVVGTDSFKQNDVGAAPPYITLEEALAHLEKRRKVLGGAVLSGGEPCLFTKLGELIRRVKLLGLNVKLDTNGLFPAALKKLFSAENTRPDYIAMDLKTSPKRYAELLPRKAPDREHKAERENVAEDLARSAELIRASGISHEFRSILLPAAPNGGEPFFGETDRAALAPLAGNSAWHIRPFVPGNCLDPAWNSLHSQTNAP